MSEASLRRREFLQRLGTGALSALALSGAVSAPLGCARGDPLLEVLLRLFDDPKAAGVVGAAYLARAPAEADRERLLALLTGDHVAGYRELAAADPDALLARLRAQHRDDFAAGRVADVDGWILSLTEARLCALAALASR
jgi:hypothetical protein